MRIAALAILALLAVAPAAMATPVGSYNVEGVNPGNDGTYRGTATVTRTGETFRVVWVIDGTRIIGTGIGNDDFIAISIVSGRNAGIALLGADGPNWTGPWATANGTQVGAERWVRR